MPKTIVIPVTLDTKGEETQFVREEIEKRGHRTLVIDVGVMGTPRAKADISREEVADAGGESLESLRREAEAGADRTEATNVMIAGLEDIVRRLHREGNLDGIISLGGSTGTAIGTAAMRALPIGVPKLMVVTWFNAQSVAAKDIAMLQTPADIIGLNQVMRQTLASAAGAISGMVEAEVPPRERLLVGITALGVTTPAVLNLMPLLGEKGLDPIVFHSKTVVLDELLAEDRVGGIIDLTTFEVMIPLAFHLPEEMAAGRLGLAGEKELPQVIVPGGLDMFVFPGTKESVSPEYHDRRISMHGPDTVLVRTTAEEVGKAAGMLAQRANASKGKTAFVIPARGFSDVDREGHTFYDPEADAAFVRVVRETVREGIEVVEVDAHINDSEFAAAVAGVYDGLSVRP